MSPTVALHGTLNASTTDDSPGEARGAHGDAADAVRKVAIACGVTVTSAENLRLHEDAPVRETFGNDGRRALEVADVRAAAGAEVAVAGTLVLTWPMSIQPTNRSLTDQFARRRPPCVRW